MKKLFIIMTLLFSIGLIGCEEDKKTDIDQAIEQHNQQLINQNNENESKPSNYKLNYHVDKIKTCWTDGNNDSNIYNIKSAILQWIENHKDKSIVSISSQPMQGGASDLFIIYEDKIPNDNLIVDVYNTNSEDTDKSYNYINQYIQNGKKVITTCSINGWRGGISLYIIISSNS